MAYIWEKAKSILAGNLNSGLIYLITTVNKDHHGFLTKICIGCLILKLISNYRNDFNCLVLKRFHSSRTDSYVICRRMKTNEEVLSRHSPETYKIHE